MKHKKINSNSYGGFWIFVSILVGGVIPGLIWYLFHQFLWWLCLIGGFSLLGFIILFLIEMRQDFGFIPFYEKTLTSDITFDPKTQYAVVLSSICTGEKMAGFRNKKDRSFTEVMLVKTPEDLDRFKKMYGIETVKTEY